VHQLLGSVGVSTNGDWHLAYAEHVEHVELTNQKMKSIPGFPRFEFKRKRIVRFPSRAPNLPRLWHHGVRRDSDGLGLKNGLHKHSKAAA
jgi:hypothetical protein